MEKKYINGSCRRREHLQPPPARADLPREGQRGGPGDVGRALRQARPHSAGGLPRDQLRPRVGLQHHRHRQREVPAVYGARCVCFWS